MMVLGANYRSQFHPKVVGVTGSVGKTTTKQNDLCRHCRFWQYHSRPRATRTMSWACPAPCSASAKRPSTRGGDGNEPRREIERLSKCARPDVGIITCIGVSHIATWQSGEHLQGKAGDLRRSAGGCSAGVERDDPFLRKAVLPDHVRPVWFSLGDENADVCALSIQQDEKGMSFVLEDHEEGTFLVKIPAMGRHNVANALAAYCAATRLGLDARRVIAGLADFEQTGMRQKVVHVRGVDVIEDCYNANPDSMKAALAMFREYPCKRRFALLGDMLELGDISRAATRRWAVRLWRTRWTTSSPMASRPGALPWWLLPRGCPPSMPTPTLRPPRPC